MYYRIKSNTGDTYLAINKNNPTGGLIINSPVDDDSQLWSAVAIVNSNNQYRGIAIVSKMTGLAISAPNNDDYVTQVEVSTEMQRATWNLGAAIQLFDDTKMNLNVRGNGPYPAGTAILDWSWSGGAANETWTWEYVES